VKVDKTFFEDKLFGLHPYHLYGIHKLVFLSQGQQGARVSRLISI
jgi:hypothetical protein